MTLYPQLILDALRNVRYPGTGKDIVSMGLVEDNIRIDGMNVTFSLLFEKPNDPFIRSVVKAAETAILTYVSPDVNIKGNITVKAKQLARPEPETRSRNRLTLSYILLLVRRVGKAKKIPRLTPDEISRYAA